MPRTSHRVVTLPALLLFVSVSAASAGFALRMADHDRDGDPDALMVRAVGLGSEFTLLRNDGSGSFEVADSFPL